ncbi:DHH family phosphoesterase [Desulfogranum japonicum]|uniref:DHH family phosphoesterase n=1 Tax=Desulfogranum japonicum TaxID=231447 RepID=UPI000419068D|nr:bifunctional oligoribonuclease/PAP phosphatase NrnA [Desulfogranum japonicum]
MKTPEQVLVALQQASSVILATHINPDGDAIGSLLGLMHLLEGAGKKVFAFAEEPVSHSYRFLPGSGQVNTELEQLQLFRERAGKDILCVSLDCGDEKRLGRYSAQLLSISPFMVIDHHRGNDGFGSMHWIEPDRSSTGEMIYDLAVDLDLTITPEVAECLYVAISTDTGSFKYESTSKHTHNIAGYLLGKGVKPAEIATHLYDNYTLGRLRLMQEVLATLEMFNRDRIAIIRVSQNMLERTFTTLEDTESFINLPRSVRSVRVSVFLKEINKGLISVSMRAKGKCDVSVVAAGFGGGGHKNASGFRVRGKSIDQVRDMLVPILEQATS